MQPALEPYALRQTWSAQRPLSGAEWGALFSEYLATLTRGCTDAGSAAVGSPVLIGHIKLLALFDGPAYLRVSVVSPVHPPTITGAAPDALGEVKVTLNVLVYGLPAERLAALTAAATEEAAARWDATVEEDAAPVEADDHTHYHSEGAGHAD